MTSRKQLKLKHQRASDALSRANRDAFDAITASVTLRKAIAVVGAGISVRLGYPSWSRLLTLMGEEVLRLDPGLESTVRQLSLTPDILWRAERFRNLLGEDRYHDFLRRTFRPRPGAISDATVKNLVRIPFTHFITTNYDEGLEQGHLDAAREDRTFASPMSARIIDWTNASDVREFMYELRDVDYTRRYIYLHGRYNNPTTMILTDRDYTDRYLRSSDTGKKLFGLLSTQTLVFVGYSMTDPAIMNLLREVKINLGTGGPRHFAILALNPAEEEEAIVRCRLAGAYGVEPIFYPYTDDHRGLDTLLTLLHKATTGQGPTEQDMDTAMSEVRIPQNLDRDPDDPQKNRWGGLSQRNGFTLSATVERIRGEPSDWCRSSDGHRLYKVTLMVRGSKPPLTGAVRFHLHPTFIPDKCDVIASNNVATLEQVAWGAFTVGAELLDHNVSLELDLSELPDAPSHFTKN